MGDLFLIILVCVIGVAIIGALFGVGLEGGFLIIGLVILIAFLIGIIIYVIKCINN